jgi:hypothetical protein
MTYHVVFSKRFNSDGNESEIDPTSELDVYLADGIVADKQFVERFEPEAKHSQGVLDEDDAFLGMSAAEVWEYEVLDERAGEFEDAIRNSQTVMEFEVVDETITDDGDLSSTPLGTGDTKVPLGVPGGGTINDGPGGQMTTDRSAGGEYPDRPYLALDQVDGIASETGSIEDLTIVSADDPSLGLTDYGDKGPDDWAANVGPDRVPDRNVAVDALDDDRSTLAPDDGRHRHIATRDNEPIHSDK